MAQAKKSPKRAGPVPAKRKTSRAKATKPAARSKVAKKKPAGAPKHVVKKAQFQQNVFIWLQAQIGRSRQVLKPVVQSEQFAPVFAVLAVLVLLGTTVYWAILSAHLQRLNADQLVDTYLFQSWQAFHQATFPGAHSFLLKWPVYWLMHLFGYSRGTFTVATVALSAATVLALAAVLHRLLRQQLVVFGAFCLALASVLLLVPAQPGPGVLLPVNMAMSTTRNIEYVFFLASLYAFVRSRSWRDKWFKLGLLLAIVLLASDKLFAPLFIGGALVALFVQLYKRRQPGAIQRWLVGSVVATIAASVVLQFITALHITTISNSAKASPYPLVHSVKALAEALIFGVGSLLTNFGANPVHQTVVIKDIPSALWHSLGYSSLAYIVNACILVAGLVAAVKLWKSKGNDLALRFAVALVYTSIAAAAIYVLTDHYYPVDARYLTISLFALFIAAAVYARQFTPRLKYVLMASGVLLLSIIIGIFAAQHEYSQGQAALNGRAQLNRYVVDATGQYNVGTLIGNYWYVTPAKSRSPRPLTVVPMADCRTPQDVLASANWLRTPHHQAVAYLAVRDGTRNTYDGCTYQQLTNLYGTPSKRLVVAGSSSQPRQLLLIYNQGVKRLLTGRHPAFRPKVVPALPTPASTALKNTNKCLDGATLNVVAHEDDDLLFMNPDLLHTIRDNRCVTTVYLTSGDSGNAASYITGRQQGSEAAYSFMYGLPDIWHQHKATVNGHEISVAYLEGQPNVTLIFFNLPDGGLHGAGFIRTNRETLSDLRAGYINTIHSTDGTSAYTAQELTSALTSVMEIYQPDAVHTQDYNSNQYDGDHSDHHAAGYYTKIAYLTYSRPSVLRVYSGYPGRYFEPNVSGQDLADKQAAFLQYAKYDPAVCQTIDTCQVSLTYGNYLTHQYSKLVNAHVEPE